MKPRLRLTVLVAFSIALLGAPSAVSPTVSGTAASAATAATTETFRDDTVLVGFQVGTTPDREQAIALAVGATDTETIGADTHVLRVAAGTVLATIALLTTYPEVRYAEPDYDLHADQTPTDPMYSQLWGLPDIQADQAWDATTGTATVVVGVVDTGVDYTHPDLAANVWTNDGTVNHCPAGTHGYNVLLKSCDPMDDNNHGTHVSGTIGAVGNNSVGVVGVNWNTRIMGLKFLGASGSGTTSDAIDCLNYVAIMKDRGVNIVASNNSWGGGGYSQALRDAIDSHRQRGMLFVAAAGNDGGSNDTLLTYPCSFDVPNIICGAATNASDALSSFSNFGKNTVHLGAPGEDILSTVIGDVDVSGYAVASGTSMATPHVTGAVALINSLFPGIDWRAAKNRILASGDTVPSLAQTVTGKRLNLLGALT